MSIKMGLASSLLAIVAMSGYAQASNMVYCSEGSPEGFDPAHFTTGTTFDASANTIYNGLVEFKLGTTEVLPGLAESWDISDDGLVYTFKLRKGVKFHSNDVFTPSRDLNADDIIFSFERQADENNAFHKVGGPFPYFDSMEMAELVKSYEKVDDYTVRITLNHPEAPFLANLAMAFASILSKEYADKMMAAGTPENLNQKPIGTGAFEFVNYQKDAIVRYKRFDDFWGAAAKPDNLIFAITPDASIRYQRVKAGECQVMAFPNPADIEAMQGDPALKVMTQEGLNVGYLAYNTQMPPFDNPRVRKALNMAIDKPAIIDVVYQGMGQAAKNPIPPTMWSYNNDTVDDSYDPEKAKKILAEEGIDHLDMKIWAMPVQRPYNPNARRMAEMMQEDLGKIGVNVEIVSYEWGEYIKRGREVNRDGALLMGWTGDNGDPDNFMGVLLGCGSVGSQNMAMWCYEPFDKIIQQAKQERDHEKRVALYEQAQLVFKDQAPWMTIAHSTAVMPMAANVTGYVMDPLGGHYFQQVDIEPLN